MLKNCLYEVLLELDKNKNDILEAQEFESIIQILDRNLTQNDSEIQPPVEGDEQM